MTAMTHPAREVATSRNPAGHAVLVGVTWLARGIAAEIAFTLWSGRPWFGLIGSPASPALRYIQLGIRVAAPALFARSSALKGDSQS